MIDLKKHLHLKELTLLSIVLATCTNPDVAKNTDKTPLAADNNCIASVIAVDDSLANIRNKVSITMPLSKAINQYTSAMQKVNFQNCSEEFKQAFSKHLKAWQNMVVVTDRYPSYRGELHEIFEKIKSEKDSAEFNARLKVIWDTWGEIEKTIPPKH